MRIVKVPCLVVWTLTPAKVRAEGEHTEFIKTTETQSSQRKTTLFNEK
jgi:hypothetical protein